MKLFPWMMAVSLGVTASASTPMTDPIEQQVHDLIAHEAVTLVHFWAPWCGNCRAEMTPDGWAKFVAANPQVKVVFVNIWHRNQDPTVRLREGGLGAQPNFLALNHGNPSSVAAERLNRFLDLPITWVPTTWVFRGGQLRYALNYGEIRFALLQTLVNDAQDAWTH
ncbi:MAG: thioredoxin family protein [Candidatus Didemnitutus sp.]|nr:thioredoxin family protein [Candidatus Didemnitutus sp.]